MHKRQSGPPALESAGGVSTTALHHRHPAAATGRPSTGSPLTSSRRPSKRESVAPDSTYVKKVGFAAALRHRSMPSAEDSRMTKTSSLESRGGRKSTSVARDRRKTFFTSMVNQVRRATKLGVAFSSAVDDASSDSEPELVLECNGLFIDSLHRLLRILMNQLHHTRMRNFVADTLATTNFELGEDDGLSDDEQEEHAWKDTATFRFATEIATAERLTSTVQQDIEAFWRKMHGRAWPVRVSTTWTEAIRLPSAGLQTPHEVRASGNAEGPSVQNTRLARYAAEVMREQRRSRILLNKADAWVAHYCPRSVIGLQHKNDLRKSIFAAVPASPTQMKDTSRSNASSDGDGSPNKRSRRAFRRDDGVIKIGAGFSYDPPTTLQVRNSGRQWSSPKLRQGWASSKFKPLAWKQISPMPCKEAPPAPARWPCEPGSGVSGRVGTAGAARHPRPPPPGEGEEPGLGQLDEWPPRVAAEAPQADTRRRGAAGRGASAWAREYHEHNQVAAGLPPGRPEGPAARSAGRAVSKHEHTQSLPLLRGPAVPATPATPAMMRQEEERAATPLRFPCCPTKQLLHSSASGGALPELPRKANQPFPSLAAKVRDLGCGDRVALSAKGLMAGAVQTAGIEEVDFGGNLKLDEYQLSMLMASLCDEGASANLRRVSLRRCAGVGMGTLSSIIRLLSAYNTTPKLRHLDLSGVQIGMKSHKPLCCAIKEHSALKDVRLADAGLGSGMDVKGCVGDLLASTTLRMLDLSWNCFSADIFSSLGEKLAENQNLRSLNLSNCAATTDAADVASPAACFIEHLSRDRCLQRLDLSLNRVDFRAALCLEDAMDSNRTLEQLDLSHNPLGVDGMRSAVRMMTRDGSGLNRLICEGCSKGYSAPDEYPWEPANPGVKYSLDLERPQDRALLRMILKLCDRLGAQATSCMLNVVSNQKYKNPQGTDSWGLWDVPRKGKLSFTLSVARMLEGQLGTASEWQGDTVSWLQRQSELLRPSLSRKKEHLLIGFWRQCHGMVDRQQLVLTAISRDFSISNSQLLSICQDEDDHLSSFLLYLLPCLGWSLFSRYLALGKTNNLPSCVAFFRRSQKLLAFNPENASGHYHLDLENPCERMVAQQMVMLDSWESLIDQQVGRADTSQRGNRSHFRNERHLNVPLQATSVAEWAQPPSGTFEFDYVSSRRPAMDAPELSRDTLNGILRTLTYVSCSSKAKLACLRQVADQVFLRAMQLREIMGLFKDEASRADLFVIFCLRLTDTYNRKLVMTRLETTAVVNAMLLRVGHATFFPFIQPEQAFFELDLLYHDQRLCLNMFCVYSFRERPENLRDVQYMRPDGTLEKLELGVPRSWEQLSRVPTSGVVRGRYVCAPESRRFQMRKEFLETYGFWNCRSISEADVRWWYTMSDVPADVINLVSYIVSKWDITTPSQAYPFIVQNKPFFAFSTFEQAFSKRFCTDGDNTRLHKLFRYFDATGDGRVSLKEWCILDQLWDEIRLSVQELAQFLERTFKAKLEDTWIYFDKDGSGTVTEEEWTQAVMRLGYYGPLKTIFAFLDYAERGVLQKQAFVFMKNFRQGILAFETSE